MHSVGTFCFAELHTPEPERSARFYRALLNWTEREVCAGYWIFELDGRAVAGMRRSAEHRWVGYVHVTDVDQIVTKAVELGATVPETAVDTPGVARTCLLADPEGAIVRSVVATRGGGHSGRDRAGQFLVDGACHSQHGAS